MALQLEQLRATAERVAASHHLDVVEISFQGAGKHRALQVFLEKDSEGRAKLVAAAKAGEMEGLPSGIPVEALSGITHEDCEAFARDFGTVLDVEDLIPGAEYTLEVSSPGLERKLRGAADYERFAGSLAKVQTFEPVNGNRSWTGRMSFADNVVKLDLSAVKQKGKAKKASVGMEVVEIALANVEKAQLIAEI